jgi:hypothetical protein
MLTEIFTCLHFIILALYIVFKLIKNFKRTDFCWVALPLIPGSMGNTSKMSNRETRLELCFDRIGSVLLKSIRFYSNRFGFTQIGSVLLESDWFYTNRFGFDWIGSVLLVSVRFWLNRFGFTRIGFVLFYLLDRRKTIFTFSSEETPLHS